VFLTVEKLFIINLYVLSSVLYRWRSLEATVRLRLKTRGRRETEVARRKRGGIKRGENKLASNHFPMWSPQSLPFRDVHGVTEKRRGRKETEVARRIKGEIKRKETDPASNQFPKCSPQPRTHKEIHRVG